MAKVLQQKQASIFQEGLGLGWKYLQNIKEYRTRFPHSPIIRCALKFAPRYFANMLGKHDPLSDGLPWLTYPAIEFLEKYLTKDMRVYEFGAGGSTLFFAQRVSQIAGVEHNKEYWEFVKARLTQQGIKNAEISLIEPQVETGEFDAKAAEDPNSYISAACEYQGYSFKEYAQSIERYPDNYFDLILIDGRVRNSCLKHSLNKLKPQGLLVVDNYTREHYRFIHATLQTLGWRKHEFPGPLPYSRRFSQTGVWEKIS